MARPPKQTVDYFPHYSDASNSKTLYILESKYGNDGYAFWFKLLELLSSSAGHVYDVRNPVSYEFLMAKTHTDENTTENIMTLLVSLGAIDSYLWGERLIWVQNLVDNIADVYRNRTSKIPQKPSLNGKKPPPIGITDINNGVSYTRKPQTKLKETKLKETKEKRLSPERIKMEFDEYVEELRPQYNDLDFDKELKRFHLYWSEGNRKLQRPKSALTNWMDKAREFKREDKGGKDNPTKPSKFGDGWR